MASTREILEVLEQNNIQSLWHFTDIRNLRFIKKFDGLRSKEFLERKDYLRLVVRGGNETSSDLDKKNENWNKISLYCTPYTPFAYIRKKELHLVWIEIDPIVATFEEVYFTDRNATSSEHKRDKGIKGLKLVNFEIINRLPNPLDNDWKTYVQAEALVPHHIPAKYFKAIHFVSEASLKYGEYLWPEKHPPFVINKEPFLDSYSSIRYPYVKKVIITHEKINERNEFVNLAEAEALIRERDFTVIAEIKTTTNCKACIKIEEPNNGTISQQEYVCSSNCYEKFTCKISRDYSYDKVIIAITLNEIPWFKEKKKVINNYG